MRNIYCYLDFCLYIAQCIKQKNQTTGLWFLLGCNFADSETKPKDCRVMHDWDHEMLIIKYASYVHSLYIYPQSCGSLDQCHKSLHETSKYGRRLERK